jgi:hypothetical protein
VSDELGTERRAADSDHEQLLELPLRATDFAGVYFRRKRFDRGEGGCDFAREVRGGGELRGAKPVVADHALLVGIRERPGLEPGHGIVRLLDLRLHGRKEIVGKRHPRDVERNAEVGVVVEVFFEAGPGHGKSGDR